MRWPLQPADSVRRDGNISGLSANTPADSVYAGNKANPMRDARDKLRRRPVTKNSAARKCVWRELGATHYMLETWGQDNSRYRFVCKMSVGGNAEVTRYFQAIDDNPGRRCKRCSSKWKTGAPGRSRSRRAAVHMLFLSRVELNECVARFPNNLDGDAGTILGIVTVLASRSTELSQQ